MESRIKIIDIVTPTGRIIRGVDPVCVPGMPLGFAEGSPEDDLTPCLESRVSDTPGKIVVHRTPEERKKLAKILATL